VNWNLFRRKQEPMLEFNDPALVRERQDDRKDLDAKTQFDGEWESLERRFDFKADLRREQLRKLLPPLYQRIEARRARIAWLEERQYVVNVLMQAEQKEHAALRIEKDRFARSLGAPETEPVRRVYSRVRNLNIVRRILHDITADARYAKPFDLFLEVRHEWEAQHAARMRVFTHVIAPGFRPSPEDAPWADALARLRELETPSSSPRKEVAHAG
jgi:hypothetical protein